MKKIFFISGIILIAIILVWLLFYFLLPVQITTLFPSDNDKIIPTDTTVSLSLNKKYWLNNFSLVVDPVAPGYSVKKSKNQLTFTFNDTLKPNTTYKIRLDSNKSFVFSSTKTKSLLWQFTTGADIAEVIGDMNFGDFFQKNPLARYTPFENEHFRIDWPNEQDVTTVTLFATFNAGVNGPPIEDQEKAYQNEIRTYKQEALKWINDQGVDPNSLKIVWFPEEATNY